jgi:hypothetical protein
VPNFIGEVLDDVVLRHRREMEKVDEVRPRHDARTLKMHAECRERNLQNLAFSEVSPLPWWEFLYTRSYAVLALAGECEQCVDTFGLFW